MLTVVGKRLITQCNHRITLKNLSAKRINHDQLESFDGHILCSGIRFQSSTVLPKNDWVEDQQKDEVDEENRVIATLKKMAMKEDSRKTPSRKKPDRRFILNHFKLGLHSYIFACMKCDMMHLAQQSFLHYRIRYNSRLKKDNPIDISIYNLLLKGWAKKGNIQEVLKVFKLMRSSKIDPDMNTYANILLAVLSSDPVDLQQLSSVIDAMKSDNLELKNLFSQSSIPLIEREIIRDKFSFFLPDLEFSSVDYNVDYPCDLLKGFKDAPRTSYQICPENDQQNLSLWCQEQLADETRGTMYVPSVYPFSSFPKDGPKHKDKGKDNIWNKHLNIWRGDILKAIHRDIKSLKKSIRDNPCISILPFLKVLKPEDYVDIILDTIISYAKFFKNYSPPLSYLQRELGRRFADRYHASLKLQTYPEWSFYYNEYLKYYQSPDKIGELRPRDFWNHVMSVNNAQYKQNFYDFNLTPTQKAVIGKFLFQIIVKDIKVDLFRMPGKKTVPENAFFTIFSSSSRGYEEIRAHRNFQDLCRLYTSDRIPFQTSLLPMKVPPAPWLNIDSGGYLLGKTDFVRPVFNEEDEFITLDNLKSANLTPIFDSLNALSIVAWKVNKEILDVAVKIFQDGGCRQLDIPLNDSMMPQLKRITSFASSSEKSQYLAEKRKLKIDRSNMFSLWCDCLYKLSIANYLRERVFWLPYNIDFRGRVYACPPYLNHLGNDLSRSLMLFAIGKPLGPKGLDWLKIHLVNLTGHRKRQNLVERLKYCDEILDDVIDSADNPLNGKKWWAEQDEPWQILACSKEIAKAIRHPDCASMISHFPVHQDGSCNGLQHYAALGRDLEGGTSVNLCPSERPNDVYSDVAELVERERREDAKKGVHIACLLENKIQRRVVKQTVMTYVYGVTPYGAKLQIHKQLKEYGDLSQLETWACSAYLTKKTFKSIATMFKATQNIQHWFTRSARFISFNLCAPVEWQTPLGLPVVQPYFAKPRTNFSLEEPISNHCRPNVSKQRNAFPPNFIHSLDSSHMMLTALECERNGLNFVAIHDSYWTHPINLDEMNTICREKFVRLHSEEILKNFSNFMVEKYGPLVASLIQDKETAKEVMKLFKNVPTQGELQLESVMSSVYFFS